MAIDLIAYKKILQEIKPKNAILVAVSKNKPVEQIRELYEHGHRDFGENYVQELIQKQMLLPPDIRWHVIGHLQRNKVKYIVPFIHLIHSVDSYKLLNEIDRQAVAENKIISCLLQVHIAKEETKSGFDDNELLELAKSLPKYKLLNQLNNVKISGLMGMASLTKDMKTVRKEFRFLKALFDDAKEIIQRPSFTILSMGMSSDYDIALEEGSNVVRIGTLIFGERI
jgi:pyridoxal phosphate enzyme (YggS family)